MKKPYVAIVDDDSAFAAYLRTFLSLRGYEARCYTRGDEMLASMKQSEPPDVVLLDVMMPGLDGLATLTRHQNEPCPKRRSSCCPAGTQVLDHRRGCPTRRRRLRRQAGRPRGTRRNRARRRHQERDREDPPRLGAHASFASSSATTRIAPCGDKARRCAGSRRSSSRWPTATSPSSSEARAASARSSSAARSISAPRGANRPFVKVNCAALPADLLESELFGHERGAFTGAATTRIGKFEQADGGTLMLDEIGEMKPALQAKLLHVLQDAEFTKLGSNKRIQVDVRVVAATNRDLEKMMVSGDFREDLYYRLKVIELTVPSLRERRDEIPTLTDFFIARYSRKYRPAGQTALGRAPRTFSHLRLARKHPRAREHDQADRRAPGRAAGGRGNPAEPPRRLRQPAAAGRPAAPGDGRRCGRDSASAQQPSQRVGAGGIPVMPVPAQPAFRATNGRAI